MKRDLTLLKQAVDGDADAAVKVKCVGRVLKSEPVSPALRAPVVKRRIRASVLEVTRYSAVDDHLPTSGHSKGQIPLRYPDSEPAREHLASWFASTS